MFPFFLPVCCVKDKNLIKCGTDKKGSGVTYETPDPDAALRSAVGPDSGELSRIRTCSPIWKGRGQLDWHRRSTARPGVQLAQQILIVSTQTCSTTLDSNKHLSLSSWRALALWTWSNNQTGDQTGSLISSGNGSAFQRRLVGKLHQQMQTLFRYGTFQLFVTAKEM